MLAGAQLGVGLLLPCLGTVGEVGARGSCGRIVGKAEACLWMPRHQAQARGLSESSGWFLMGGHDQRRVLKRGLGLMCAREMRTGGRGVRAGAVS